MSEEMKNNDNKKISRREVMKKAGKYAAVTSVTMMVLSPKASAGDSPYEPEGATDEDYGTTGRRDAEELPWWLP